MVDWMDETDEWIPGINKSRKPRNDKDERLNDLQRFTKSKRLHLQPGMHRLLDELLLFPRGNKNILDGLWYATRSMYVPDHTKRSEIDDDKHFAIQYYGTNDSKWMSK